MEYRRLGRTGIKVSVLSFGSWVTFDTQLQVDLALECMQAAHDAGCNFFDNAEAYAGGNIALIEEGDSITIDAHTLTLQLNVDDAVLTQRRAAWKAPAPRYTRGVLAKFAKNASSASTGAVLDPF